MIQKIFLAILMMSLPVMASAQTRISLGIDHAHFSTGIENHSQNFMWNFISAEAEHQFNKLWLPGVAFGVRKEGNSEYSGSYIALKLFHAFDTKNLSVITSGGAIYGLPGIQFDRTQLVYDGGEVVGYRNISMKRHIRVSQTEIDTAGVLQPIAGIAARKYIGRLFVEGHGNLRFAEFSKVSSDLKEATYEESTVVMPSLGVGIGFTF